MVSYWKGNLLGNVANDSESLYLPLKGNIVSQSEDGFLERIAYFKAGIRNIKTMGTITRSSRFLCKSAAQFILPTDKVVIELGAGDGVITRYLLKKLPTDGVLLSFEILPHMLEKLRLIEDPRLFVIDDSAENIGIHLQKLGHSQADYIMSALPFSILPEALGISIVGECHKHLKPGGKFVQMHYSLMTKWLYQRIFGNVETHFIPLNVPPAFLLESTKG